MIKKTHIIIVFLLLLMFSLNNSFSQDTLSIDLRNCHDKNYIKINPWGMLWGSYQLSYERFINSRNSIEIYANYKYNTTNAFLFNYIDKPNLTYKIIGFMTIINYKRYFLCHKKNNKLNGNYMSSFFRYSHIIEHVYPECDFGIEKSNSYKFGFTIGHQTIYSGMVIDLFVGTQLGYIPDGLSLYSMPWDDGFGWIPGIRCGINFGFGF
ncbi:MAG TPA: hypothetical protein PKK00_06950 [Bacteroidales bacterium]|nr:hypothetical protein [Bacteroidales bacterium]HPS17026.1 hypothetical protein [Bacteroidales bacterium]